MKLLILSDSHGNMQNINSAVRMEKTFDVMAFCGDSQGSLDEYEFNANYMPKEEQYSFYAVCGNCDYACDYPAEVDFECEGYKIYMTHGHMPHLRVKYSYDGIIKEALRRKSDIVFFGHTHIPVVIQDKRTGILLINPGSLTYPRGQISSGSYAVLDIEMGKEPKAIIKYL